MTGFLPVLTDAMVPLTGLGNSVTFPSLLATTYWIERDPPGPKGDSMRNQF